MPASLIKAHGYSAAMQLPLFEIFSLALFHKHHSAVHSSIGCAEGLHSEELVCLLLCNREKNSFSISSEIHWGFAKLFYYTVDWKIHCFNSKSLLWNESCHLTMTVISGYEITVSFGDFRWTTAPLILCFATFVYFFNRLFAVELQNETYPPQISTWRWLCTEIPGLFSGGFIFGRCTEIISGGLPEYFPFERNSWFIGRISEVHSWLQ